jgi:N-acetylmuramoyl-L-alanine amidase
MILSPAALLCLSLNVYHEARDQPVQGQLAVAHVTMNRVAHEDYPDTVCGVVWDNKQFSWTHDNLSDTPVETAAWEEAQFIALIATTSVGDTTNVSTHYHADYVMPYWVSDMRHLTTIGNHLFYAQESYAPLTSIRPVGRF